MSTFCKVSTNIKSISYPLLSYTAFKVYSLLTYALSFGDKETKPHALKLFKLFRDNRARDKSWGDSIWQSGMPRKIDISRNNLIVEISPEYYQYVLNGVGYGFTLLEPNLSL